MIRVHKYRFSAPTTATAAGLLFFLKIVATKGLDQPWTLCLYAWDPKCGYLTLPLLRQHIFEASQFYFKIGGFCVL